MKISKLKEVLLALHNTPNGGAEAHTALFTAGAALVRAMTDSYGKSGTLKGVASSEEMKVMQEALKRAIVLAPSLAEITKPVSLALAIVKIMVATRSDH